MEFEYTLENEQQFWDELDEILDKDTHAHDLIDDTLRTYLGFITQFKNEYLVSDYDILRCAYRLLSSKVYRNESEYVRTQIVYCILQEDAPEALHVIITFVLFDGRQNESTFETLNDEGGFSRIVELVQDMQGGGDDSLHRRLLELMYEMCRVQRIKHHDLVAIDEDFVLYLLRITESLSSDVEDPYHYYVIRVLLVLNEQYMVCAHEPGPNGVSNTVPNLVILALSRHGAAYKTFGENIILLLNRESETSLQLLILKLLYLLFTTPATYEYFYTNDLHVLVDVMIRNLLDLAYSSTALRHTYLRVLYPLLAHTQLKQAENRYKRDELLKLLAVMGGSAAAGGYLHFGAMDETTRRLVKRCMTVEWLQHQQGMGENSEGTGQPGSSTGSSSTGSPRTLHLQIGQNAEASRSALSIAEVTAQHAQPGVRTLSRGEELARGTPPSATMTPLESPFEETVEG